MRYHNIPRMAQTRNKDSIRLQGKWISSTLLSWVFIGGTDVEAETPILWPPDAETWLIWKDPDAGKDWGQEEKGTTEDEMVGWHHWHNGHGFEWTPGVGDGQRGLACCGSWGRKESYTTEQLNWLTDYITGGTIKWKSYLGKCLTVSLIDKNLPHERIITLLGIYSRHENESLYENPLRSAHSSCICNSPKLETIKMPINKWAVNKTYGTFNPKPQHSFLLLLCSCSVMFDSLQPHGL